MSDNTMHMGRRGFLGTGLLAAVTRSAAGQAKHAMPYNPRTHKAMPTHNLGRTGYRVGILSLGGQATLEIPGKEAESEAILNRAIDLGVNYIDSAAGYGKGTSEKNIGRVLKTRRKEVWVTSKTADRTYDGSMRLLDSTLSNMQTDHLDLWQIHNLQTREQLEQIFAPNGAIKALQRAREQGTANFLGVTGHYEPNVLADAIKRFPFDTILMAINAADRHYLSFLEHLLPLAQQLKMGTISMKVATRGRVLSTWTPPPAGRAAGAHAHQVARHADHSGGACLQHVPAGLNHHHRRGHGDADRAERRDRRGVYAALGRADARPGKAHPAHRAPGPLLPPLGPRRMSGRDIHVAAGCEAATLTRRTFLALPALAAPPLRFAVLSDIQYADQDTKGKRAYRQSLAKLETATARLRSEKPAFVIHLGDLVDGGAENAARILPVFRQLPRPQYHVLGNHDFFGPRAAVLRTFGMKQPYYAFRHGGWQFIVLDGMHASVKGGWPEDSPQYREGAKILAALKAGRAPNAQDWNGAAGAGQRQWLQRTLEDAARRGERAIVFCHFPVLPAATTPAHLLWDREEVLGILDRQPAVAAYMCGHDHNGGYAVRNGVQHVTLRGMVEHDVADCVRIVELHGRELRVAPVS